MRLVKGWRGHNQSVVAGPKNTGGSGIDELISIENIIGSSFADKIIGNTGANVIDGGSGSADDYLMAPGASTPFPMRAPALA